MLEYILLGAMCSSSVNSAMVYDLALAVQNIQRIQLFRSHLYLEERGARVGVSDDLDKNDNLMMPNRVIMT